MPPSAYCIMIRFLRAITTNFDFARFLAASAVFLSDFLCRRGRRRSLSRRSFSPRVRFSALQNSLFTAYRASQRLSLPREQMRTLSPLYKRRTGQLLRSVVILPVKQLGADLMRGIIMLACARMMMLLFCGIFGSAYFKKSGWHALSIRM